MKRATRFFLVILLLAVMVSLQAQTGEPGIYLAQAGSAKEKTSSALSPKDLFFTEPYSYLNPPVRDLVGMCLDLDYVQIKYDYGFVNLVDNPEPAVSFKKRVQVKEPKPLARIKEKSGFWIGDRVTVVSAQGLAYPATIVSFSYVGNSPSTIIVTADLKPDTQNPDPTLFTTNGLALRGLRKIPANPGLSKKPPLSETDPNFKKFLDLCIADIYGDNEYQDPEVAPVILKPSASPAYAVSFWKQPKGSPEIEDIKIASCLFLPAGESFEKANLPNPLKLIQVYDLDGNGQAELLGLTGDGVEVCLNYQVPVDKQQYLLFKQGLCAGY